jgi:hypothetical protein
MLRIIVLGSFFAWALWAWLLGGQAVCAGFMARFDITSRTCSGGKLLNEVYRIPVSEHLSAAVEEGAVWFLLAAFVISLPALARLRNAASQPPVS